MTDRPAHDAPETQVVNAYRVCCDGGEGALGHPRVWLSIPLDTGWVDCGYCDKRFIHEDYVDAVGNAA
ncbi:MAG: zinc-finger domain-containing protein [Rhodobacteraceae bacterium]|nr:zinc-finger domain-containing protein [Paracoccaceae bacterium]